ncbi:ATP-binding protein [Enorma phocaeensis]|uniref:ATP-binding protein n=1 Tax=Enorma phocaeensis TaxID=1871019 RepID=UPI001CA48F07|nr:AAA family ATPase [Enorma phocaeensis]
MLFLQRYRPPVLIDEIQKAPKLLPYIKEIVDASDQTGTVWLTSSQPFHLMKEASKSLAGRVGVIEMLGLSGAGISGVPSEPFSPVEFTSCAV